MLIELRSEQPGDESVIDGVICSAFGSMDEPNIVRLLREHYPDFDPELSIVALDGDEMIGHAQFTPASIRMMGRTVRALALGPIAVVPDRQKQGIGGMLLQRGHEVGRRKGFELVFLMGHPDYYPRHGYEACFGFAGVTIDADTLPEPAQTFRRLPVTEADMPWLVERHAAEWAEVDFGWLWGDRLSEWRMLCVNSTVWWTDDGRRAAYTMAKPGANQCAMLLADDPATARDVIATIRPSTLEHHPAGWLAREALAGVAWASVEVKPSKAAMAFELRDGMLDAYRAAVASGDRLTGHSRWPLPFLAC